MIFIDKDSKAPIYQQIYEFIKKEIEKEQLKPGDKLPSSRALSRYLSVSRSTIDLAYDQLASEGYIEAMPCKGYYVSLNWKAFIFQIVVYQNVRKKSQLFKRE